MALHTRRTTRQDQSPAGEYDNPHLYGQPVAETRPQLGLGGVGFLMLQGAYENLEFVAGAAASSGAMTWTISRIGLDPKVTAVFTAATATLYFAMSPLFDMLEDRRPQKGTAHFCRPIAYCVIVAGASTQMLPGQPIAKLFVISSLFLCLFQTLSSPISPAPYPGLFRVAQHTYRTLPTAALAVAAAGGVTKLISKIGLDPRVAMIFTAATSVLYYAANPLLNELSAGYDPKRGLLIRSVTLLALSKVSADVLKLELPMYKPFAKACTVAILSIYLAHRLCRRIDGPSTNE